MDLHFINTESCGYARGVTAMVPSGYDGSTVETIDEIDILHGTFLA